MSNTGDDVGVVLLDLHTTAAAVATLASRQLGGDEVFAQGHARGNALDDNRQPLTVGLTCREVPDHENPVFWPAPQLLVESCADRFGH